jgi:hypothetical protein
MAIVDKKISVCIRVLVVYFFVFGVTFQSSKLIADSGDANEKDIEFKFKGAKKDVQYEQFHASFPKNGDYKRSMNQYMAFLYWGQVLQSKCQDGNIQRGIYNSQWKKDQAIRTFLANLQFYGIDLTIRALSSYAHHFNFSKEEYSNLTENLVGNYCSKNISIMGHRKLKELFHKQYEVKDQFVLANVSENPLFPFFVNGMDRAGNGKDKEFVLTVKLFRAFCSWGGTSARLLVPFLKNPIIMSALSRRMNNLSVSDENVTGDGRLLSGNIPEKVNCRGYVCRMGSEKEFYRYFPKSVGYTGLQDDFEKMYCTYFKQLQYSYKGEEPHVQEWLKVQSFDEDNLLVMQMISLMTGIPDFAINSESFESLAKLIRTPLDNDWMEWALLSGKQLSKSLTYEETVNVAVVDRELYFDKYDSKFKVVLDVNLGEYDKSVESVGKLSTVFNLKFRKNLLRYYRKEWKSLTSIEKKKLILHEFEKRIRVMLDSKKKKFIVVPWKGKLEKLIAYELMRQFDLYKLDFFYGYTDDEWMAIPIEIRYGPYALKYFNYRFLSERSAGALVL